MAAAAAAADARAALSRPRVVARVLVHAAQVVGLAVLLRALAESPWAAAAAPSILRVAAFFLSPPRLCFLAVHVIVIVLARFIPRDAASLTPSSFADPSVSPTTSSNGDAPQRHPILAFLEDTKQTQQLPPITESEPGSGEEASPPPEDVFVDKEAVHVTTVRIAQPPLRTMSEKTGDGAADKEAVQAKTVRAKPPRRTMSDKTRDGGGAAAAAAGRTSTTAAASSPELRRAKSENGRRRQRRSAAAATAPVELVTDDAEAFRQAVEAFIAKQQTWFHREESLILARASAAAAAADTGGEDRRRCCCGGREVSA